MGNWLNFTIQKLPRMKRRVIFISILSFIFSFSAIAQDETKLFGPTEAPRTKTGLIFCANGDFDIPAGNIAKEFGPSYRAGPGLLYKTNKNWIFGLKCDFILGNIIKQDSLMINIVDKYSAHSGNLYEFIDQDGQRIGIPVYERGYAAAFQAGKIIPTNKERPDNGIMLLTSAGFMQYKLDIFDKDKAVPQLQGQYLKGYDRLTNGVFVEEYGGYIFFSKSRLVNFTLGLDALIGFTQDRRTYLYDVMRSDNTNRLDMLFGLRGGWFIPTFKRKSEELNFQ